MSVVNGERGSFKNITGIGGVDMGRVTKPLPSATTRDTEHACLSAFRPGTLGQSSPIPGVNQTKAFHRRLSSLSASHLSQMI